MLIANYEPELDKSVERTLDIKTGLLRTFVKAPHCKFILLDMESHILCPFQGAGFADNDDSCPAMWRVYPFLEGDVSFCMSVIAVQAEVFPLWPVQANMNYKD